MCWGQVLDDRIDERMMYVGRGIAYMWVLQIVETDDIWKVLDKKMGESWSGHRVCVF